MNGRALIPSITAGATIAAMNFMSCQKQRIQRPLAGGLMTVLAGDEM
jgi:hypothetical protein